MDRNFDAVWPKQFEILTFSKFWNFAFMCGMVMANSAFERVDVGIFKHGIWARNLLSIICAKVLGASKSIFSRYNRRFLKKKRVYDLN